MTPVGTRACQRRVLETIERHRMIGPQDSTLVAFSGGRDSTALALLLARMGFKMVLGHVNHGLRAEAGPEAEHCAAVARSLGVPFRAVDVQVRPPTPEAARRGRYQALEHMAEGAGATKIATGHTLDDQAETVVMRLQRGGYGLGIPPVRGNIVRPILGLRRRETGGICDELAVPYLNDPSNQDSRYARVRIREELAAVSDRQISLLEQLAASTRAEARQTEDRVERLWCDLARLDHGLVMIARAGLRSATFPVARGLVRRAAAHLGAVLGSRLVDDVVRKVLPRTGSSLDLPTGLCVWSEPEAVVFGPRPALKKLPPVVLSVPGSVTCPAWGLRFSAELLQPGAGVSRSAFEPVLDASAVGEQVLFRQWMPGDRFQPLGTAGSKKLQDFFVDRGVPRRMRPEVPLMVSGERIAWVIGHRIDERFKVRSDSTLVRLGAAYIDDLAARGRPANWVST